MLRTAACGLGVDSEAAAWIAVKLALNDDELESFLNLISAGVVVKMR
jgi:hypothetical protein